MHHIYPLYSFISPPLPTQINTPFRGHLNCIKSFTNSISLEKIKNVIRSMVHCFPWIINRSLHRSPSMAWETGVGAMLCPSEKFSWAPEKNLQLYWHFITKQYNSIREGSEFMNRGPPAPGRVLGRVQILRPGGRRFLLFGVENKTRPPAGGLFLPGPHDFTIEK